MMEISYYHSCGYCKHFNAKNRNGAYHWYCEKTNEWLRKDYAKNINGCADFDKDLSFTSKQDVEDFIWDRKCAGCEYSVIDRDGNEGPDYGEDSYCCGCGTELNEVMSEIDKTDDLNLLIRRYTCGNDRTDWEFFRCTEGD